MSKFKLRLTGISDDTGKPQTLEMEAYAKDAEELAARLDKEFNLKLDENGWSMYIEWLSDDDSKLELDPWDAYLNNADCGVVLGYKMQKTWDQMMYDYLCGTEYTEKEKNWLVKQRLTKMVTGGKSGNQLTCNSIKLLSTHFFNRAESIL